MTRTSFSDAARRLSKAAHGDGQLDPGTYDELRAALSRILYARFRKLGAEEILDIVDETIFRVFRHAETSPAPLDNPSSWMVSVAMNLARDAFRRLDRDPPSSEVAITDDETARLLDQQASRQLVDQALAVAIERGDQTAVRVVTAWLDQAAEAGEAPGSREVGDVSGYSHTTVNDALSRFREYLGDL